MASEESVSATEPSSSPCRAKATERILSAGQHINEALNGGELRSYCLPLKPGQYLDVRVEQLGIDVKLELLDSDRQVLAFEDSPNGSEGPEQLLFIAEQAGDFELRISAFGSPQESGSMTVGIEELRDQATSEDQSRVAGCRRLSQGYALYQSRKRDEALSEYREALRQFQAANDLPRIATAWFRIGWMLDELDEKKASLEPYGRALELFHQLEDSFHEGVIHTSLGRVHRSLGQTEAALESHARAVQAHHQIGNRRGEATARSNWGSALKSVGQIQEALDNYRQALDLWIELGEIKEQATALNNLGRLYLSVGRVEGARDVFSRSLEISEAHDLSRTLAIALNGLGDVHHRQGATKESIECLERALEIQIRLGSKRRQAITLNSLGTANLKAGRPEQARRHFEQALKIFHGLEDLANQAITLLNIGRYHYAINQLEQAVELHRRALPLYRRVGNRSGQASTLYGEARALYAMGSLDAALDRIEAALIVVEGLRTEPEGHDVRESYFADKQRYWELCLGILLSLDAERPGSGFAERALEVEERRRSRTLLDLLAEARADIRRDVSTEWLSEESEIRKSLNRLEMQRLDLEDSSDPRADEIVVEQRNLAFELEQVRVKIRQQGPGYAELTESEPLDIQKTQQLLLDSSTQMLVYSLGDRKSVLWWVSRREVATFDLPARDQIESLAEELYQLMLRFNGRSRLARRQTAAALSDLVLGPVADRLTAERLLVITDGALQYLPFAALPVPQKSAPNAERYLVEDHEVISLPSASTLSALRSRRPGSKTRASGLAVIADPVYDEHDPRFIQDSGRVSKSREDLDPNEIHSAARSAARSMGFSSFQRLPYSGLEAEKLLSLVPENLRKAALGFDANREAVLAGELQNYRILHFATHGLIHRQQPDLSGLVLSMIDESGNPRDGFLRLHDVYTLRLNAELVVLSACRTGLGREVRGEGLVGLTRGFMFAGVPRVVVSLWSVSDHSTAELMVRFYERLITQGMSYPQALREAQLSMLREGPWQDPYHWAGFVFQGDWRGSAVDGGIGEAYVGGTEEDPTSDEDLGLPKERESSKDRGVDRE